MKRQWALEAVGQAGKAGFAVDVGGDFEIQLANAEGSVGDPDFYFRIVDGLVVRVGDGEVGGAGPNGGIDGGDGVGIGRAICLAI